MFCSKHGATTTAAFLATHLLAEQLIIFLVNTSLRSPLTKHTLINGHTRLQMRTENGQACEHNTNTQATQMCQQQPN